MKKLISDLESAVENYKLNFGGTQYDDGMVSGFETAIEIVKSYDPWIDVSEELPHPYEQEPSRSIEVLILTEDGNIYTGVYVYEQKAFFILNRRSIAKEIKWTYLPEVKR